jgi:hypothetical protein
MTPNENSTQFLGIVREIPVGLIRLDFRRWEEPDKAESWEPVLAGTLLACNGMAEGVTGARSSKDRFHFN